MTTPMTIAEMLMFLAIPAAPVAREWTDSTGRYRVEAALVDVQGESVRLKKQDGAIVAVPIGRLSAQDQRWVKQQASGKEGTKSSPGGASPARQVPRSPDVMRPGEASKDACNVKSPAAGTADKPSIPQWPRLSGDTAGPDPLRIRNPSGCSVKIALRCGTKGLDFSMAARDSTTVYVRDACYDIYFQYSDDPHALYQGDSFTLSGHGAEIQLIKVVDGNFGIRRVK